MTSPTDTTASQTTDLTGDYAIDPTHSRLGFVAKHAMVTKVRGAFNEFEGTLNIDAANPSKSSAQLTINAGSIDTRNGQRDEHLRTNDFLDVPTFPKITFVSTSAEQVSDEEFRITGDLTIKDVTKQITIDLEFGGYAKDPYGNDRIGFEGKAKLNRKDFNVNFHAALEAGGLLVSDKIDLEFEVSAVKTA